MPNRAARRAALPCPVLDWANNPRTHHDRDRLQHLVRRVHTRHPLTYASANVRKGGWALDIVSAVTGRLTQLPASLLIRRSPDGATILPPPTHYGRDLVAELGAALDESGRHVTHPTRPAFRATTLQMAVLRSACGHQDFMRIADHPLAIPHIEWRDDQWRVDAQPLEGTVRPAPGCFVEYWRTDAWEVRRIGHGWEFDRHRLHLLGATLPESVADACRGRIFDDVFDVPDLRGAGLVIRAVKNARRAGGPSLRVTIATRRMDDIGQARSMSLAMDAPRTPRDA